MEIAAYVIGVVGGLAPLVYLVARTGFAPAHDTDTLKRATEKAYKTFLSVGIVVALFVCGLVFFLFLYTPEEPGLGLHLAWYLIGNPLFLLVLAAVLYGLYQSVNARRDSELSALAAHSSLMFVASFLLTRSGSLLLFLASIVVIVSYPITCIVLARRGRRRLAR